MNLISKYTDPEKSERSLQVHRQVYDNTIPKTIPRPQSPTQVRDVLDYTKLYHTVKRERHNLDGNYEENIDTSAHISDRLWKTVLLGRKSRYTRNISQSDSSNYTALTSSSVIDQELTQITNSWKK